MEYYYKAALGGGFGGTTHAEWVRSSYDNYDDAIREAYEAACDEHDSYAGLYGIRDYSEIMEQEELTEQEAWEKYFEELESWLYYIVLPRDEIPVGDLED